MNRLMRPSIRTVSGAALRLTACIVHGSAGCATVDIDGDGWSEEGGDCNDDDEQTFPGAVEACDGIDRNCDGASDSPAWYLDQDGDVKGLKATIGDPILLAEVTNSMAVRGGRYYNPAERLNPFYREGNGIRSRELGTGFRLVHASLPAGIP